MKTITERDGTHSHIKIRERERERGKHKSGAERYYGNYGMEIQYYHCGTGTEARWNIFNMAGSTELMNTCTSHFVNRRRLHDGIYRRLLLVAGDSVECFWW